MAHPLDRVNTSELLQMVRTAGFGNAGPDRERAIQTLEHGDPPLKCELERSRELMEIHIEKNFSRLRTQLPGCNGKCVSFGCPVLRVVRCWWEFRDDML